MKVGRLWTLACGDDLSLHAHKHLDELTQHDKWASLWGKVNAMVKEGGMVCFVGAWGTGKTQMAAMLLKFFCYELASCLYMRAREIGMLLRESYRPNADKTERAAINHLVKPKLLVVDELHERFDTDFERRSLSLILDKRYAQSKPTVLIANVSEKELPDLLGPNIIDRIHEKGAIARFDWSSFRRQHEQRKSIREGSKP